MVITKSKIKKVLVNFKLFGSEAINVGVPNLCKAQKSVGKTKTIFYHTYQPISINSMSNSTNKLYFHY